MYLLSSYLFVFILYLTGNGSYRGRVCDFCEREIVASALTLGESTFLKALYIETPTPPS